MSAVLDDNEILRKFWEIEELIPKMGESLSIVNHFKETYTRNRDGRFIVTLPRRSDVKPLGESRSQAVRRFHSLERSLIKSNQVNQHTPFNHVIKEYLDLGHAELVSLKNLKKPAGDVFYLPMHVVYKSSSTTTKIRAVFDASANSTSGVSLNDCLLVGPTVHSPFVDVLLRFRLHKVAITTDISKKCIEPLNLTNLTEICIDLFGGLILQMLSKTVA